MKYFMIIDPVAKKKLSLNLEEISKFINDNRNSTKNIEIGFLQKPQKKFTAQVIFYLEGLLELFKIYGKISLLKIEGDKFEDIESYNIKNFYSPPLDEIWDEENMKWRFNNTKDFPGRGYTAYIFNFFINIYFDELYVLLNDDGFDRDPDGDSNFTFNKEFIFSMENINLILSYPSCYMNFINYCIKIFPNDYFSIFDINVQLLSEGNLPIESMQYELLIKIKNIIIFRIEYENSYGIIDKERLILWLEKEINRICLYLNKPIINLKKYINEKNKNQIKERTLILTNEFPVEEGYYILPYKQVEFSRKFWTLLEGGKLKCFSLETDNLNDFSKKISTIVKFCNTNFKEKINFTSLSRSLAEVRNTKQRVELNKDTLKLGRFLNAHVKRNKIKHKNSK